MSAYHESSPHNAEVFGDMPPLRLRPVGATALVGVGEERSPDFDTLRMHVSPKILNNYSLETLVHLTAHQRECFISWLPEIGMNETSYDYEIRQNRLAPFGELLRGQPPTEVIERLGPDGETALLRSIESFGLLFRANDSSAKFPNSLKLSTLLERAQQVLPEEALAASLPEEAQPNMWVIRALQRKTEFETFELDGEVFRLSTGAEHEAQRTYGALATLLETTAPEALEPELGMIFEVFGARITQLLRMYEVGHSQQQAADWFLRQGLIKQKSDFTNKIQTGLHGVLTARLLALGSSSVEPVFAEVKTYKYPWLRCAEAAYTPPASSEEALRQIVAVSLAKKDYLGQVDNVAVRELAHNLHGHFSAEVPLSDQMKSGLRLLKTAYEEMIRKKQNTKEPEQLDRFRIMSRLVGYVLAPVPRGALNAEFRQELRRQVTAKRMTNMQASSLYAHRMQQTDLMVSTGLQEITAFLKHKWGVEPTGDVE
jgi:hypothetical protein